MYFSSRSQAGQMLANRLVDKYRYENCAVIALNDGGVIVGAQIAKTLHCVINLLVSEEVSLPREPVAIGGITPDGNFSYNSEYSESSIEELTGEYHGFIEEEKIASISDINKIIGSEGLIDKSLLKGRNIILVSDGFKTTMSLDLAYQYLKPIKMEKLIVATPLASVKVVDWMHVYADDIYCLTVLEDFTDTNHYYDKNDIPSSEKIRGTISNIVLKWK